MNHQVTVFLVTIHDTQQDRDESFNINTRSYFLIRKYIGNFNKLLKNEKCLSKLSFTCTTTIFL